MPLQNFNKELVRRYRDNRATKEELEVFFQLLKEGKIEMELKEVMNEESEKASKTTLIVPMYKRIWFRIAAAAAILILIGAGSFFIFFNKEQNQIAKTNTIVPQNDIAPGGNKAVLTLGDSSKIILDNAQNGTLAQQGNTNVSKMNDGQIAYNVLNEKPTEVLYNTITTPRGGQYQLTLSDGSKVWLNAASSIRFPTAFIGNERKVEITGEAYFEITHDETKPFKVNVAGKEEVEVLGTHFNINSYSDEATINTTLLEGRVKISSLITHYSSLITPGQQAQLNSNGEIILKKDVNKDEIMAWKNGQFYFEDANLKTILRQITRWYDVDVIYEGSVSDEKYFGIVSRNSLLSEVLKSLQANAIQFRIEGKKLYIK